MSTEITALIKRCQSGDENAFADLLGLHYDTIYRIAFRWCGDKSNAEDITQNVSMKLAQSIHQFRFQASFTTWLYQITINSAKDFYKSPKQFNTREESDNALAEQMGKRQDQERQIYAQQLLAQISNLPEELREALILVFVNGLNHLQAATVAGVKESTISWRIHEARKQLKALFESADLNHSSPAMAGSSS